MRWSPFAAAGVVSCLAIPAFGQDPLLRPAREMLIDGPAQLWDVELADLDADGDLDLYTDGERFQFTPGAAPEVLLYDDLGGYRELAGAVDPAVGGEYHSDLAFADLDGDGDADAYRVSSSVSQDQVLLGDGTGKLVLAFSPPPADASPLAVALADLDLDGDIDAVSDGKGVLNTVLRVQVNLGPANFTTTLVPSQVTSGNQSGDIAMGDVDEDGLPDLVLALGGPPQLVLNGPGLALADAQGAIPVDAAGQEVELGDLDGDGHLDLAFGTDAVLPGSPPDLVYRGDGLGTFTLAGVLPGGERVTTALDLDDLDGDGDLDVVLAFRPSSFPFLFAKRSGQALLRNDGGFGFVQVPAAFESLDQGCEALALGDLDQDGDADVVLGQEWMQTRLLLGDGALGFAEATMALPWSGADGAILLADLDGDGDLDGWASLAEAQVQRNPGNGVLVPDPAATAGAVPPVKGGGPFALAFDCNGDGALDVYQCRGLTILEDKLYVNDGAGAFALLDIGSFSSVTVAAGDVDGDGDADLVLDGGKLLRGDGAGGFVQYPFALMKAPAAALADLDQDGDLDLVRGFPQGFVKPAVWNAYVGPGFGADMPFGGALGVTDAAVLDVEGDGDADVLFASTDGPVLWRNDGAGVFTDVTAALPQHAASYFGSRLAVADLDGDGDQDFVATTTSSYSPEKYFVYLNHQGVFIDGTAAVWSDIEGPAAFAVGDVDRDGDVDFVGTEPSGRLRVITNHARQLAWRGLPRAGKDLALDASGPKNESWALALSPGQTLIPLAPFGALQLDPVGLKVIAGGLLDAAGQAAAVGLMPPVPGAVGLTVYAQAIVGFTPRFTNLELVTLTAY